MNILSDIKLNLIVPEGETGLINADISRFKDRFDDYVGFIITARGIDDSYCLLKNKGITKRELQRLFSMRRKIFHGLPVPTALQFL
jgi:hypothetical protein